MASGIKTDFKHTKKLIKKLNPQHIKKVLFVSGEEYKKFVLSQWTNAKNGNNKSFPGLTPHYKAFKQSSLNTGHKSSIPDMHLSKDLIKTVRTSMNSNFEVKVEITDDEDKLRGLVDRNKNITFFDITQKKARKILGNIHRRLQPK